MIAPTATGKPAILSESAENANSLTGAGPVSRYLWLAILLLVLGYSLYNFDKSIIAVLAAQYGAPSIKFGMASTLIFSLAGVWFFMRAYAASKQSPGGPSLM